MNPICRIAMLAHVALLARVTHVALVALVALPSASAGAQQANGPTAALSLRSLAATCAQCHGTDGRAPAGSIVPGLAGVPAAEIVERMLQFKAGTRAATLMPQIANGYSDAQIRALAAYFAAQAR
ncbi:MAG: c-type cytochrome [Caldimonas sp.]